MNKKLPVIVLILLVYCFAWLETASARTWTPGVAKGDYFYYEMYGVYNSSNPNSVFEVPKLERNNTEWVRIDVTEVSGSTVYQVYTAHFNNGTETKNDLQTNLDPTSSGAFDIRGKGIPICAANLSVGDPLPTVQLWINDTRARSYSFGNRETNYVAWNTSADWGYCYFDKQTGVLLELYRTHQYTDPLTGETISKTDVVNLKTSNLWQTSEPSLLYPPILITSLAAALVLVYFMKLKRKKNVDKF